jgi:hypothetical protein
MLNRTCRICTWWGEGQVVEILESRGVRRAKIVAAGALVEVAALGGGEIHLGDRIPFDPPPVIPGAQAAVGSIELDDTLDVESDTDIS